MYFVATLLFIFLVDKILKKIVDIYYKKNPKKSYFDKFFDDEVAQADFFYKEMKDRIYKMAEDDNETHISEWFEILPFCKYIDEWYKKTHPGYNAPSLEKKARKEAGLAR